MLSKVLFWVAIVLGVLGILGNFVALPLVAGFEFWMVAVGFVLLLAGKFIK